MTWSTRQRMLAMSLALTTAIGAGALASPVSAAQSAGSRCGSHPWCDIRLTPDRRAELLLSAMTLDEELSLLGGEDPTGVAGGAHAHTGTGTGIPRLDVPTVYYSDGPQGPRQGSSTGLPSPLALAATFNTGLAAAYGDVVADEVKHKGNDVVYGPTVNVLRTPLNGRTFESYGEDPYLLSRTTVAWIEAAQATGVLANVKHFAANNQEGAPGPGGNAYQPQMPLGVPVLGDRLTENSIVDARTLHEVYLPQFEAAVREAHVATVMCSYNRLGGTYACENPALLTGILRKELGFTGYVLSDYGAAKTPAGGLNAGLAFEPFPGVSYQPDVVRAALASGQVTRATVDARIRELLRTMFAYGIFDRPAYVDDDSRIDKPAHARTSQRVAESATVLLRNDGLLPLSPSVRRIAVIGKPADSFVTGGGSGNVTPFRTTTLLQALRARPGVQVDYQDGSDAAAAAAAAKAADVAIVAASQYQTEGSDNDCLTLECPQNNGDQDALIQAVASAQPRTVVVLETGGPVLTPWRDRVGALLEAWYPGADGGPAIARVLFGDVDPGGRLPATFPASADQLPTAGDLQKYPGVGEDVTYKEGVLVGYRWYDAHRLQPAYEFGAGLSYTSFGFGKLTLRRDGQDVVASLPVTNTGRRTGTAVPQLYAELPSPGAGVVQPPRQLRGYSTMSLAPGQTRTAQFRLPPRAFEYWDVESSSWRMSPACYRVVAGSSSRETPSSATISRGRSCAASTSPAADPAAAGSPRSNAATPPPNAATSGRRPVAASRMLPATGGAALLPVGALLLLLLVASTRRRGQGHGG